MNSLYKQDKGIAKGSLADVAKTGKTSIAEAFISCDAVAIVDTSGSMAGMDGTSKSRYQKACAALRDIQAAFAGQVAVVSFSEDATFCPSGIPVDKGGSTRLDTALRFAKIADIPGMKFWIISDGMPDNPDGVLDLVKQFKCKIDTVFIGPDDDSEGGREFLQRLAKVSGGRAEDAFGAEGLGKTLKLLKG